MWFLGGIFFLSCQLQETVFHSEKFYNTAAITFQTPSVPELNNLRLCPEKFPTQEISAFNILRSSQKLEAPSVKELLRLIMGFNCETF